MARLRRIAAIGDVHAEDARLDAVLAAVLAVIEDVDAILCVGDVVDGQGDAERSCALLREAGAHVVRGNHDRWLLRGEMRRFADATTVSALSGESLAWLGALPTTIELPTIAGPLLLCHAVGRDDTTRLAEDDHGVALEACAALGEVIASGAAMMVCGHTHRPHVRRVGELVVVNAGTLHRDHEPGFAVIDLAARTVERHEIDHDLRIRPAARVPLP